MDINTSKTTKYQKTSKNQKPCNDAKPKNYDHPRNIQTKAKFLIDFDIGSSS